jgi:hypothetical protein
LIKPVPKIEHYTEMDDGRRHPRTTHLLASTVPPHAEFQTQSKCERR